MCLLATSEFSHEAVKKHQDTVITALKVSYISLITPLKALEKYELFKSERLLTVANEEGQNLQEATDSTQSVYVSKCEIISMKVKKLNR